jgi:formylglycine-generating enzyme required for sulfatase activity
MRRLSHLAGLLLFTLTIRAGGQSPKAGNPSLAREYPGLKETQVAMILDKGPVRSQFRATVIAKGQGELRIITAAHCLSARDVGMPVRIRQGTAGWSGRVATVIRNPVFPDKPRPGEASGDDAAFAILSVDPADADLIRAFEAIQAAAVAGRPILDPSGQTVVVYVRNQFDKEYAFRAGNYSNPKWLEWGRSFEAVAGDSGSGVLVFGRTPEGKPQPILVGVVSTDNKNVRGGTATLISKRDPWLREALSTALPKPAPRPPIITNPIGMKIALIPDGEFLMGSPESDTDGQRDERPQHRVRITKPFYFGVYEVTQDEYRRVMGDNPSTHRDSGRYPVELVSWHGAVRFCNLMSELEGLPRFYKIAGEDVSILGGKGYRLPTEAEWEYACRAGSTTKWSFGDDVALLGDYAWHEENSEGLPHEVGLKAPNAFGLYDLHGGMWEWCWDWYGEDYYRQSPAEDPTGPRAGELRIERGGARVGYLPPSLRCAYRDHLRPSERYTNLGFRVARSSQ